MTGLTSPAPGSERHIIPMFVLLVTLVSVHVAQAELLLPNGDQGASPAVPVQRLDLESA